MGIFSILAVVCPRGMWLDLLPSVMATQRDSIDQPVTCRKCGTKNEQFYTYCRHCLEELPAVP
ncbi:DUF7577 domain-containing protein [Natronococcus zhouii]